MERFCFVKAVGTVFISEGITRLKCLDTLKLLMSWLEKSAKIWAFLL